MLVQYGPHFLRFFGGAIGLNPPPPPQGKKFPVCLWLFGTLNILEILQLYASRFHYAYYNVN